MHTLILTFIHNFSTGSTGSVYKASKIVLSSALEGKQVSAGDEEGSRDSQNKNVIKSFFMLCTAVWSPKKAWVKVVFCAHNV